jgi:RNA polymerase sigma-70 factor (ECF subfamily)
LVPSASRPDETLLQAALGGAQEAWDELVNRYHKRGMSYVRRYIDDPYLAQDIMQNLWAALVGAVRRQPPDQFGALFWTLVKRRLIDELRKKGRTKEASILDGPTGGAESDGPSLLDRQQDRAPDPAHSAIQSEEQQVLYQALDQLPDHYRIVIIARQLEGRTNRETAQILIVEGLVSDDGNVEKRVENYYYRGLKELKKQLEALGYYGGGSVA